MRLIRKISLLLLIAAFLLTFFSCSLTLFPELSEDSDVPDLPEPDLGDPSGGTDPDADVSGGESFVKPYSTVPLKEAAAGDVIVFGTYEQDGNASNGAEPLEWLVLKKDGSTLLAVTLYGVERMQFHDSLNKVTWETSAVRSWLNTSFLDSAFSAAERLQIETTTVTAERNPTYPNSPAGNDTEDKLFLLSVQEAETYFSNSSKARICSPAPAVVLNAPSGVYAHSNKAWYAEHDYLCSWWLRSPGMYKDLYVSYVDHGGNISGGGQVYLEGTDLCVRPAVRIRVS